MIWLTWRQFRIQAVTALAVLAAAAAYLIITGLSMHRTYAADLAGCSRLGSCVSVLNAFQNSYDGRYGLLEALALIVPGLIGIFWGAPLIGRELEAGTHQLAWNQSVTRTRWLAAKLTGVGAAAIAVTALLGYLLTWWSGPLDQISGNRFGSATFVTHDVVPLAYAAFFFAVGTTLGLLFRRTIPAMAVTIAVFVGVQALMPNVVRPHLLPSTTVSVPIDQATANEAQGIDIGSGGDGGIHLFNLPAPKGAWILSTTPIEDSAGQTIPAADHPGCFPNMSDPRPDFTRAPDIEQVVACLIPYDLHESISYQPASRYWPLQWCETAAFAVLAAALSGFCFWWIRRRVN